MRALLTIGVLVVTTATSAAQQPCTTDAAAVVAEVHRQILQREPDDTNALAQRLASGATVKQIVSEIAHGNEHTRRFLTPFSTPQQRLEAVGYLYRHLLNRAPDVQGARSYADLAASRGVNVVIDDILGSAEYRQAWGDFGVPGSGLRYCGSRGSAPANVEGTTGVNRQMRFREMDRNGDGEIARSEWRGSTQSFKVHDWNGDGRLSGDEVRPGAARYRRMEEEDYSVTDRNASLTWSDADFRSLDRNNDRRITRAEWYYNPETFDRADRNHDGVLSAAEFFDPSDDDRNDSFEYLDVNGNGRIDRNEWHGNIAEFNRLDRNGDAALSRAELLGAQNQRTESDLFSTLDEDRDGRISRVEWRWSLRSFYSQDTNDDGFVTRQEFAGAPADSSPRR